MRKIGCVFKNFPEKRYDVQGNSSKWSEGVGSKYDNINSWTFSRISERMTCECDGKKLDASLMFD